MRLVVRSCLASVWLTLAIVVTATVARAEIPLPADITVRPTASTSSAESAFLGVWAHDAWNEERPAALVVQSGASAGLLRVTLAYDRDKGRPFPAGFTPSTGRVVDGELRTELSSNVSARYRVLPDGRLFGRLERRGTWHDVRYVIFDRLPAIPHRTALTDTDARPWRMVDIPMTDPDTGRPIALKATYYPSSRRGTAPLLLMGHGDVSPGYEYLVKRHGDLARLFVSRGWAVLEMMRRGTGGSGGTLLPEFRPDSPPTAAYGDRRIAADIADVDAVVAAVRTWPDIDANRIMLSGHSRGGMIAIEYLAARPDAAIGAVNFSGGGWCEGDEQTFLEGRYTVDRFAKAGASIRKPTLWLYGDNDSCFSVPFIRRGFDAYRAAGGTGELLIYSGVPREGHDLLSHAILWEQRILDMLQRL